VALTTNFTACRKKVMYLDFHCPTPYCFCCKWMDDDHVDMLSAAGSFKLFNSVNWNFLLSGELVY